MPTLSILNIQTHSYSHACTLHSDRAFKLHNRTYFILIPPISHGTISPLSNSYTTHSEYMCVCSPSYAYTSVWVCACSVQGVTNSVVTPEEAQKLADGTLTQEQLEANQGTCVCVGWGWCTHMCMFMVWIGWCAYIRACARFNRCVCVRMGGYTCANGMVYMFAWARETYACVFGVFLRILCAWLV